jgi:hypothetical protein
MVRTDHAAKAVIHPIRPDPARASTGRENTRITEPGGACVRCRSLDIFLLETRICLGARATCLLVTPLMRSTLLHQRRSGQRVARFQAAPLAAEA